MGTRLRLNQFGIQRRNLRKLLIGSSFSLNGVPLCRRAISHTKLTNYLTNDNGTNHAFRNQSNGPSDTPKPEWNPCPRMTPSSPSSRPMTPRKRRFRSSSYRRSCPHQIPPSKENGAMKKFRCTVCGYIYDPAENDNVPFEKLPDDWVCPACEAGRDEFEEVVEP